MSRNQRKEVARIIGLRIFHILLIGKETGVGITIIHLHGKVPQRLSLQRAFKAFAIGMPGISGDIPPRYPLIVLLVSPVHIEDGCLSGEPAVEQGGFRSDLVIPVIFRLRSEEEHTSELQSRQYLVCRLLLEKKK